MTWLRRIWLWLFYRKGWLIGPFVRGENQSKGLPWRPKQGTILGERGLWRIDGGEPHYVTRDCNGLSGSIRVRYRASGWTAVERGEAGLTVHFQREGDNWSGTGPYEFFRWYSRAMFPLEGEHEITVPLRFDAWISVMRKQNQTAFNSALRGACRVGLCFGADMGRGHGARGGKFELLEFEVNG